MAEPRQPCGRGKPKCINADFIQASRLLTIMSSMPLLLKTAIPPVTHRVVSTVAVQVGQNRFENQLTTVVQQTLMRKSADTYLVALEVLDFQQQATDLFSRVTADLNQLSQRLVLLTDIHGNITRVVNAPELAQQWATARPILEHKYADQPAVLPFFTAFEQQLAQPGTFELSLRNKGIYGVLFPGFYGRSLNNEQKTVHERRLLNFFNQLHLPLQLTTVAGPRTGNGGVEELSLQTTGRLDEAQFETLAFQRLMQSIVDSVGFAVQLDVEHSETYAVDLATGWIARGQQMLMAEVPGAYFHESKHEILPFADAP